jgi:hypothetical protein
MVFMATLVMACGGTQDPPVDAAVAPFVGRWDADSLTLTNDADTSVVANILEFGSFTINVQASGTYTATLVVFGQPSPEIGTLGIVSSSTLTLTPTLPPGPVATASYVFQSEDYLILDGPSEFDFNLDGTPEAAQVHFELQRN